jgi:dihydrolipoamide dehydrogenase
VKRNCLPNERILAAMSSNPVWDLCVIGAGPGGYAAAMRAHDLGKRVLLIERDRVGGTGIHEGALSSKTMWHLSSDFATAKLTDRGYRAPGGIDVTYPSVMESVNSAVSERRSILARQLEMLEKPHDNGAVVTFVRGEAKFVDAHHVEVTKTDGTTTTYEAANFLIATGSHPRVPKEYPVDGETIVTSDHIEKWKEFPASMVIVGAGVVGCEYATMFARFGKTKINIIDRQPRILPFEDEDVAEVVSQSFEKLGITIHRASKLESIKVVDKQVEYVITNAEGKSETIRVDKALVSIGRIPNTGTLGLEKAGVELDKGGGVVVKCCQSTSVPHIWAAGDVTMDIALVNVAELEGRYAAEKMFGLDPRPIVYEALSTIMFLSPEVASVGLNELQAKAQKVPYRVGVMENRLVARNTAMRSTHGFVKLLAAKDSTKILGLRVVGPQASSTIQGIAFLIHMGARLEDIDHCVHPHPAIPEGVQECARMLLGRSVMKPDVFGPEGLLRYGEG